MSPELLDPDAKPSRPDPDAPRPPAAPTPPDRRDLVDFGPPLVAALPAILNPSIAESPTAVMTRIALDWIIQGTPFDQLFEQTAEGQYTREFTLEHLVHVLLDVVCGHQPSTRAAFRGRKLQLIASLSAFYGKLNRMELAVTAAVLNRTARRCRELIAAAGGLRDEPIEGYAVRILDGNVLAGTDHRLVPTRTTWAACLPGKSLAVYEPASGLITDVILEEDAHTQERALLDQVRIQPGQLWVADRNFCVRTFLFRIQRSGAFFLVRRHATTLPFEPLWPLAAKGRCPTGEVFEQAILVEDPEAPGRRHRLRRIVLELDEPTCDGETEVVLVTNLPAEVSAIDCCAAYRGRWRIEGHFQVLTDLLHCEIPSLSYPRAALFAFGMSAVAGNALAVLKGSLLAAHGAEMAGEVSDGAVVTEVARIYPGMMTAIPPRWWPDLSDRPAGEVAALLNELGARVAVEWKLRVRRGPKQKKPRRSKGERYHHLATKKLLDQAKGVRPPKAK
jgi:Transposase DDE domain